MDYRGGTDLEPKALELLLLKPNTIDGFCCNLDDLKAYN